MTKHDKHLGLLAALVLAGLLGDWLRLPDAHDVALLALGGLMVEIQVKDE